MADLKQFDGLPEDVKLEMLMLIQTYSKNELINKLRSLRESPNSTEKINVSSEATEQPSSSENLQSRLEFSESVDPKEDDALATADYPNQLDDLNASTQNSDLSSHDEANPQHSESEQSYSIAESSNLDYDDVLNDSSFNPVVLLRKLPDIGSSEMVDDITEDSHSENAITSVASANIKKIRKRKSVLVDNTKTNSSRKNPDKNSNGSEMDKKLEKCSEVSKTSGVIPNAGLQSKSGLQCNKLEKDKQLKPDQGLLPEDFPKNCEAAKTASNSSKKCTQRKKGSNKNDKTSDVLPIDQSPIPDRTVASAETKSISLEMKPTSTIKEKNVNILKTNETTPCDPVVPSDLKDQDIQNSENLTHRSLRKDDPPSHTETNSSVIFEEEKLSDNLKNTSATKRSSKRKPQQKERKVKHTLNIDSRKQSLVLGNNSADNNFKSSTSSDCVSKSTKSCKNVQISTASTSDKGVAVTRSASLRKRNSRITSNNETKLTSKLKILKRKSANSSAANTEEQPLNGVKAKDEQFASSGNCLSVSESAVTPEKSLPESSSGDKDLVARPLRKKRSLSRSNPSIADTEEQPFNDANAEDEQCASSNDGINVPESAVKLPELSSGDQVSVTRSLRKRRSLSSGEAAPNSEQKVPKKKASGSPVASTHKLNLPSRETTTVKGKRGEDADEAKQNAEAYSKLSKMCSLQGLNLDDIFRSKEIQEMIEKYKNNTDAVVFIGTHKCSDTGKIEPIVHVHKSKKVLLENLIQNKNVANLKKV